LNDHTLKRIAEALERLSPPPAPPTDLSSHPAYHWNGTALAPVHDFKPLPLDLIVGIDRQKADLIENSRRHASGAAAHDVLLWGARGMGKSALVKSVVAALQEEGFFIALVEAAANQITSMPALFDELAASGRRYLLFVDDISFEPNDQSGRLLRSLLEGGVEARPNNVRLCVTSNRRNIVERENGADPDTGGRDAVDDSLALADRFGLKLGFQYPDQDAYLKMVGSYAAHFDLDWDEADALSFAQSRGGRSGRIAWHYTVELAGRAGRRI
jgi:predicted AAA+ superfamily ATPase